MAVEHDPYAFAGSEGFYKPEENPEIEEQHNRFLEHFKKHTQDNKVAIQKWADTSVGVTHTMLKRAGVKTSYTASGEAQDVHPLEKPLQKAFDTSPGMPEETHCYSGMCAHRKTWVFEQLQDGQKVTFPHHIASSLSPDTSLWFAEPHLDQRTSHHFVAHFRVPKGHPVLYTPAVSATPKEREVVLPSGSWRHTGKQTIKYRNDMYGEENPVQVHIHSFEPLDKAD